MARTSELAGVFRRHGAWHARSSARTVRQVFLHYGQTVAYARRAQSMVLYLSGLMLALDGVAFGPPIFSPLEAADVVLQHLPPGPGSDLPLAA